MATLHAAGIDFHVAIDGPGDAPVLVMAHALGATLDMWRPQVAALSRRFRLLRYDTRGHGRSGVTPGPFAMERLGLDVLALLDAAGVDRAHFCGLSMGGATGLWLAAHAPGRFERFVICDSLPWLGGPDTFRARAAAVRSDGLSALVDATLERWFTADFRAARPDAVAAIRANFLATPREGYAACCEALASHDERAHVGNLSQPVLVINGRHDPSPPPTAAREFAARLPHAKYVELDAAHLSNIGAATEFNEAVERWLDA